MSSAILRVSPLGLIPRGQAAPILRDAGEGATSDALHIKNDHPSGGILISPGTGGLAASGAGALALSTTKNAASAIALSANGGASETVTITSQQGTTAGAVAISSVAGGVAISSTGAASPGNGGIVLSATIATGTAGAVTVAALGGVADTIIVNNSSGNSLGAVEIKCGAGGIKLKPAAAVGLSTPIATITQITTKTTGVTINSHIGTVTTVALTDVADTQFSFTVTNSACAASTSLVLLTGLMPVASGGAPMAWVSSVAAGSFVVVVRNVGTTAFNSAISFNFMVFNHSA